MMNKIATELEALINKYLPLLNAVNEADLEHKPSPTKWSKKELVGHLIDSAHNNNRRFIVSQYEEDPTIMYDQDGWVAINNYQEWNNKDLVQLWYLLNRQMILILKNIPAEMSQRVCNTHTIEWLAQDYIKHLKHHMHQVLNLEPVAYP